MTRAAPLSLSRRRPRAASGWRWGALLGLACSFASTVAAQPPQMNGEYAVGGGTAFQSFTLGVSDAAAFASASVQSGGGVECPSYWGEQPFERDDVLRRAARLLHTAVPDVAACGSPGPLHFQLDSAYAVFRADVDRLGSSDPVLSRGGLSVLYAADDVVAFQRQLGDARRVIVFNRAEAERFLPLPETDAVPGPLTPIFASWGELGKIPALVAVVDENRGEVVYGLRIPPHTVVVFRPVEPRDVRPRGLDE